MINPAPCPPVSGDMVRDLEEMVVLGMYQDLELWIAEMDRYCIAIN